MNRYEALTIVIGAAVIACIGVCLLWSQIWGKRQLSPRPVFERNVERHKWEEHDRAVLYQAKIMRETELTHEILQLVNFNNWGTFIELTANWNPQQGENR